MRYRVPLLLILAACSGPGPETLGGQTLSADELRQGETVYRQNCMTCHGERGDGRGPSAVSLYPPPRDFRLALFKYAGIEDRGLPDDAELFRVVRFGLAGTAMRPWELPDAEIRSVVHYIKTFSLPGAGFRDPKLVVKRPKIPRDPYPNGAPAAVIAQGKKLYHSYFECAKCHPSYATREEFAAWDTQPRADAPWLPSPKWSSAFQQVLIPPDFLRHPLHSVRAAPYTRSDLFRVTAYGLQGPMPGYGHLGDSDAWAVVHYVETLLHSATW